MPAVRSALIRESAAFESNRVAHLQLIADFRALEAKVRETSARAAAKFHGRGQLLPRERVNLLLDRDAPFLEISTLAGLGCHEDDGRDNVFGGGNIIGIGFVSGKRVMVITSDAGIKGGANHPWGVEKQIRAQEIALENKLPLINLVESAGANLALAPEIFVRGGASFANLARMSAAGLPVISVVHGSSTAGGAYQSGLADYVVLVRGRSKIFLAGPPLLRAATGEIAGDDELGGSVLHSETTGLGEYLAEDDSDAIRITRELVDKLNWDIAGDLARPRPFLPPRYGAEEILGLVPVDYRKPYEMRELIARLVDDSDWLDFKRSYGVSTVCGYASIEGHAVGIIGNNGPIDANGATKAAQFIQLCCQTNTPILFLQNTTGFMVGVEAERAGIVKHGSKMIQAVTNADVPKITIQIGGSFGAGHYGMCGRGFAPRFLFAWPNNRVAVMGGEQAAKVLSIVAEESARARGIEPDVLKINNSAKTIVDLYERTSSALYATARVWDDGLIDPRDTRAVIGFCLSTALEGDRRRVRRNSFGIARL